MIKVLFFAALREQLATEQQIIDDNVQLHTVGEVRAHLAQQGEHWQKALTNSALLCAVNHTMVDNAHPVKAGDEVAFFPPVTGG